MNQYSMKILNILPLNYSLKTQHFRSKYIGMPVHYEFHILVTGDTNLDGDKFSHAKLYIQPPPSKWTRLQKTRHAISTMRRGISIVRKEKIDVIICYDPLTLGLTGVILKLLFRTKLIIEINGHLRDAQSTFTVAHKPSFIKRKLFNILGTISLYFSDCVKILNKYQYLEWSKVLSLKQVVMYHDFVPTQQFKPSERDESFLLCLGHPFHVKGVDILLEGFGIIQKKFPDIKLKIMGHCHEQELAYWKKKAENIKNVYFLKPVPYEEVGEYLSKCSLLVVPSRVEGMGRVFIEAMACGKACIGPRVGGVPNIIIDECTGLLVEPENSLDLAAKLAKLLSNPEMCRNMGMLGRQRAELALSEEAYIQHFKNMIDIVFCEKGKGIVYNGYTNNFNT